MSQQAKSTYKKRRRPHGAKTMKPRRKSRNSCPGIPRCYKMEQRFRELMFAPYPIDGFDMYRRKEKI